MVCNFDLHALTEILTKNRRILCYPILATIALFVNIRDDPNRPRALTDVTLLGSMVTFLSKIGDNDVGPIYQIRRVCSELERVARETVDRAQLGLKRQKLQSRQSELKFV